MNFWWNETIVISSGENWRMLDVDENFCDENYNQWKLRATKITSDEIFTAKLFYRILLSGYFRNFTSLIKGTLPWHLKEFFTQGSTRNVLVGILIIINNGNPQYLSKYRKSCSYSSGSEKSLSPFKVCGNCALLERSLTPVNGASGCPIPKVGREATKKLAKIYFFQKRIPPNQIAAEENFVKVLAEHRWKRLFFLPSTVSPRNLM